MENRKFMNESTPKPPQESAFLAEHERFPIRVLAERTSVGTSTLRAWERRYGLLCPDRTPKGHRLYSEDDSKRVFKIIDLLNDGHSLPAIAEMLRVNKTSTDMLTQQQSSDSPADTSQVSMINIWDNFIQSTLEAICDFSIERIDAIYNEASSLYPIDMVTDRLIQPVITLLGKAWEERPESGIAEEHFYTSWLKNRIGARFHHAYSNTRGARIVCACVPGSYHEIGLMLFALSAMARGYRVLYFGADLPLNQLKYIVQRSAAKAVVLGAQTQIDSNVNTELAEIIDDIKTPVFVGGSDELIDTDAFQSAGGILLGSNISVALRVFESHVPAFTASRQPDTKTSSADAESK